MESFPQGTVRAGRAPWAGSPAGSPLWQRRLWEASGPQLLPSALLSSRREAAPPGGREEPSRVQSGAPLEGLPAQSLAWAALGDECACLGSGLSGVPVVPAHLRRVWGGSRGSLVALGLLGPLYRTWGSAWLCGGGKGHGWMRP